MWEGLVIKPWHHEAISPRLALGIVNLIARNARELKRTLERKEEDSGTDLNTVEASNRPLHTDHLKSGPHWSCKSLRGYKSNKLKVIQPLPSL
jgi:hypothetical protein